MNSFNLLMLLTLAVLIPLTGCSEVELAQAEAPRAETASETLAAPEPMLETKAVHESEPEPEPEPPAELPEVVILYGLKELVPWLESEGWWGEVNRDEQLTVPNVILTAIHPSWAEFSAQLPVPVKKELFYRLMLPLVMHANRMVMNFREGLRQAQVEYAENGMVSRRNMEIVRRVAGLLPGMEFESAPELSAEHPEMAQILDNLLYRVDIIPAGLALGQAAYESGYGTSRFATQGNSLFGQWTYKGDGLKPKKQRTSSKGDYRIKAFEWPFDSVRGYFINLMSHPAYEDFRRLRAELRATGKPLDSMTLANSLIRYSERGQDYVDSLKAIMRVNKLTVADDAVFRDEPLRFLISEESPEDAEKMKARVAEAAESGELAEIIARMRLE